MTHDQIMAAAGGAASWGEEQTEHLARLAAEIGDAGLERTCDEVHAGETSADVLVQLVEFDDRLRGWMDFGGHLGWMTRAS